MGVTGPASIGPRPRVRRFPPGITLAIGLAGLFGIWFMVPLEIAARLGLMLVLAAGFYAYWLNRATDRAVKNLLLIPSITIMFGVTLTPLLYLLYISFHRVTMLNFNGEWPFVGLTNYIRLVTEDPLFYPNLVRSLQLLVFAIALQLVIGLLLALLCNREFRGRSLVSTILLLPIMTNTIVVGLLWKYMLDYQTGLVNLLLSYVNVPAQPWLTNQPLPLIQGIPVIGGWLVSNFNANYGFLSIIWTNTWQWTPFVFLLLMAGLRSLSQEPFEAARVDGANGWQTFWFITLPMLKPGAAETGFSISVAPSGIRAIRSRAAFSSRPVPS